VNYSTLVQEKSMPRSRLRPLVLSVCLLAGFLVAAPIHRSVVAQATPAAQAVWALEHEYWQIVERNDLDAYRNLWNENFLGWPQGSPTPTNKSHITDWITSRTSKGLTFKFLQFKEASIQENGDLIVTCYWVTDRWDSKGSVGVATTSRILHTWLRKGDRWQIVSGMSAITTDNESR
jgi:ketosteroid isomerase-like protein